MFSIQKSSNGVVTLGGNLTIAEIFSAEKQLNETTATMPSVSRIDGSGIDKLDTAGAMVMAQFLRTHNNIQLSGFSNDKLSLIELINKAEQPNIPAPQPPNLLYFYLDRLGYGTIDALKSAKSILSFFGQTIVFFLRHLRHPRHFRLESMARHIEETGIDAIPIVALVAFLMSIVLAYQGTFQLRPLGGEIFTVNLVALSVLREMGVLLTAIMVAGRSGSAFAAEIGVMKVNEEVDALSMIGVQPFDMLVLPRIFALLITLPLLTFMADIVGLFGGSLTCAFTLDLSYQQYWERVRDAVQGSDFFVGLIKAPVFALIISIVGCKYGMQVTGSAESVGTYTTRSVVASIFIVLVADALFSVVFSHLGW